MAGAAVWCEHTDRELVFKGGRVGSWLDTEAALSRTGAGVGLLQILSAAYAHAGSPKPVGIRPAPAVSQVVSQVVGTCAPEVGTGRG